VLVLVGLAAQASEAVQDASVIEAKGRTPLGRVVLGLVGYCRGRSSRRRTQKDSAVPLTNEVAMEVLGSCKLGQAQGPPQRRFMVFAQVRIGADKDEDALGVSREGEEVSALGRQGPRQPTAVELGLLYPHSVLGAAQTSEERQLFRVRLVEPPHEVVEQACDTLVIRRVRRRGLLWVV